ncbi:hypothetical protein ACWELP_25370 [Rhodococcus aetherivorans]
MSNIERIQEEMSKEIVIARDGLTIGGRRFPGCISANDLVVVPPSGTDDALWQVKITIVTDTPPRFIGTHLADSGEVVIDDTEEGR